MGRSNTYGVWWFSDRPGIPKIEIAEGYRTVTGLISTITRRVPTGFE